MFGISLGGGSKSTSNASSTTSNSTTNASWETQDSRLTASDDATAIRTDGFGSSVTISSIDGGAVSAALGLAGSVLDGVVDAQAHHDTAAGLIVSDALGYGRGVTSEALARSSDVVADAFGYGRSVTSDAMLRSSGVASDAITGMRGAVDLVSSLAGDNSRMQYQSYADAIGFAGDIARGSNELARQVLADQRGAVASVLDAFAGAVKANAVTTQAAYDSAASQQTGQSAIVKAGMVMVGLFALAMVFKG